MLGLDEVLEVVRACVDTIPVSALDNLPDLDEFIDHTAARVGVLGDDSDEITTALGRLVIVAMMWDRAQTRHLRAVPAP